MRDFEMDIECAVNESVGSFPGKRPVNGDVRSCVASLRSGRDSEREGDGGLGQEGVAEAVTCGSEPGLNAVQQDAVLSPSQLTTTNLTQGCYPPRSYDLRTVRAAVVGPGEAVVSEFDLVKTTERDCADRTEINGKNPSAVREGDADDTLAEGFVCSEHAKNSDGDGCSFNSEAEKNPGDCSPGDCSPGHCSPGDCSPGHCSYEVFSSDSEGEAEYDVEEAEDDDENSYDDWFAVANDEEEIRTIASADLRPFYGDFGRDAARQPFGDLGVSVGCDLEVELHSQPEFLEGFSCLETIVEETSDDMRSDVDSLRSGPVSWSWSVDSDESVSPAAVHPGPPGWTWCLEATRAATEHAAGAAEEEDEPDVWDSDEDLASSLTLHPSSVPAELPNSALETSKARSLSLDEAPYVTATSRPFLKPLQMPPPLRAAAAPTLAKDLRPRVTGEVSRDLFVGSSVGCDPDEQPCHGGDLGWCDSGVTADGASPPAGGAADRCPDRALAAAGQGSHRSPTPQARLRSSVAGRGSWEADTAAADGSAATPASHRDRPEVLGTQPSGQPGVSGAELSVNAQCWNGGGEPAHHLSSGADVTPGGCHLQQWDLGSCEDFGNLDRRIESLTFDFEEEERRTVAAIAAERLRLYDRYLRFLAEQESVTQSGDSCSGVRRFHSWCDLRMVGDGRTARRDRPSLRKWVAAGSGGDTTGKRATGRLTHLRHSSENLSEDSGFGEQAAVSWSDASSPPLSLSPSAGVEPSPARLTAGRRCRSTPDLSPSAQRRQRLRELIGRDERRRASVFSDGRSGAEVQNGTAESAEGLSAMQDVDTDVSGHAVAPEYSSKLVQVGPALVDCPGSHIPSCAVVGASSEITAADVTDQKRPPESTSPNPAPSTPSQRQRKIQKPPMPAPRTVFPQPAAVYQNVPLNAWISAGAGRGAAVCLDYQVNAADALSPGETDLDTGMCGGVPCGEDAVTGRHVTLQTTLDSARVLPDCARVLPDDAPLAGSQCRRFYNEHAEPLPPAPIQPPESVASVASSNARACMHVAEDAQCSACTHPQTTCDDTQENVLQDTACDTYRENGVTSRFLLRRSAAARPKPLDLAAAEEFVLLEGGGAPLTAPLAAQGEFDTDPPLLLPEPDAGVAVARDDCDGARLPPEGAGSSRVAAAHQPITGHSLNDAAGAPGNRRRAVSLREVAGGGGCAGSGAPRRSCSAPELRSIHSMTAPGRADLCRKPRYRAGLEDWSGADAGDSGCVDSGVYPSDWLDISMEPDSSEPDHMIGGFFSRSFTSPSQVTSSVTSQLGRACNGAAAVRDDPAITVGRANAEQLTSSVNSHHSASAPETSTVLRYGAGHRVEVRISEEPTPAQGVPEPRAAMGRVKGVQFSPVVSEVRWRETYMDDDDEPDPPLLATQVTLAGLPRGMRPPPPDARRPAVPPPPPPPRTKSLPGSRGGVSAPAVQPPTQRLRVSFPVLDESGECVRRQVLTCERAGRAEPVPQLGCHGTDEEPHSEISGAEMDHLVGIMRGRRNGGPPVPPAPRDSELMSRSDTPPGDSVLVPRSEVPPREKPPRPSMLQRLSFGRLSGGMTSRKRQRLPARDSRSPSPVSVMVKQTQLASPLRSPEVANVPSFDSGVVTSTPLAEVKGIQDSTWHDTSSSDYSAEKTVQAIQPRHHAQKRFSEESDVDNPFREEIQSSTASKPVSSQHISSNQIISKTTASRPEPAHLARALHSVGNNLHYPTEHSEEPQRAVTKPPLPPRISHSQAVRVRLSSARHQFLGVLGSGLSDRVPPAAAANVAPLQGGAGDASAEVQAAFERFRRQAQVDRERLAQSTPDLSLIETTTRGLVRSPSPLPQDDSQKTAHHPTTSRTTSVPVADQWRLSAERRARLEREAAALRVATPTQPCQETDLDAIVRGLQQFIDEVAPRRTDRAKSLLNLEEAEPGLQQEAADGRAKSMEFLLDEDNKASAAAPENALMRTSGRQLSQHQLRFQRSLRNLNTPDWYRNSARPAPPLRHQTAATPPAGGWSGLHSKTTSRESLPTVGGAAPTPLPRRLWASTVPRADSVPAASAPRARHGSETSAESCSSALSGLRRPYLGWRSQERLSGGYQTAAERLARSFRTGGRRQPPPRGPPASSDGAAGIGRTSFGAADSARLRTEGRLEQTGGEGQDVQKDIREVTDAIVQYFEDATRPNGEAGVFRTGEETPPPPRPPPPHAAALNGSARDPASSKQRPLWRETAFMGGRPHSPDSGAGGSTAAPSADSGVVPAAPPSRKDRFELGDATSANNGKGEIYDCTDGAVGCKEHGVGCKTGSTDGCQRCVSAVTLEDLLDSLLAMPPSVQWDRMPRRRFSETALSRRRHSMVQVGEEPAGVRSTFRWQ